MTRTNHNIRGFTLVELMIVIAIIGILAAAAIPAYREYVVRAKASDIIATMSRDKVTLAEHWAQMQKYTGAETAAVLGLDGSGKGQFIKSLAAAADAANNTVTITYTIDMTALDGTAGTETLALKGFGSDHGMSFRCGVPASSSFPTKYLPTNCRHTGM